MENIENTVIVKLDESVKPVEEIKPVVPVEPPKPEKVKKPRKALSEQSKKNRADVLIKAREAKAQKRTVVNTDKIAKKKEKKEVIEKIKTIIEPLENMISITKKKEDNVIIDHSVKQKNKEEKQKNKEEKILRLVDDRLRDYKESESKNNRSLRNLF